MGQLNAFLHFVFGAVLVTIQCGTFLTQPIARRATEAFLSTFFAIAAANLHVLFSLEICNSVLFDFL